MQMTPSEQLHPAVHRHGAACGNSGVGHLETPGVAGLVCPNARVVCSDSHRPGSRSRITTRSTCPVTRASRSDTTTSGTGSPSAAAISRIRPRDGRQPGAAAANESRLFRGGQAGLERPRGYRPGSRFPGGNRTETVVLQRVGHDGLEDAARGEQRRAVLALFESTPALGIRLLDDRPKRGIVDETSKRRGRRRIGRGRGGGIPAHLRERGNPLNEHVDKPVHDVADGRLFDDAIGRLNA